MSDTNNSSGAGFQINVDLNALNAALQAGRQAFEGFNQDVLKSLSSLSTLEKASQGAANSTKDLAAGFQIIRPSMAQADPSQLTDKVRTTTRTFQSMTQETKQLATMMGQAGKSFNLTEVASRALSIGLGILGVQSLVSLISRIKQVATEAVQLAINFEGVQARAKAIFGDSFPQLQAATAGVASQFSRSKVQMLDFATGFGTILDSVGASTRQIDNYSVELTKLTVNLGKAFPDKSDVEIYDAVSGAIEGNLRGLRSLGIVVNDKVLQDYAESQGIKTKLAHMDAEQKSMLITQYLLTQTAKLQQAGAASTDTLGNSIKETNAQWVQFLTSLGTDVAPIIETVSQSFLGMLENWGTMIGFVYNKFLDLVMLPGAAISALQNGLSNLQGTSVESIAAQKAALDQGAITDAQNQALAARNGIGTGKNRTKEQQAAFKASQSPAPGFDWSDHSDSAAKGKDPATARQETLDKIAATEKDIVDALGKEAEANKKNLDATKEALEAKKAMGTITQAEQFQLDNINRRLDYQKDAVKDATDAWKAQKDVVKGLQDDMDQLNEKSRQLTEDHKQKQADIDKETNDKKAQLTADLLKEQNDLQQKFVDGEGLSLQEQRRLDQIKAELLKQQGGSGPGSTFFNDTAPAPAAVGAAETANLQNELNQLLTYQKQNPDNSNFSIKNPDGVANRIATIQKTLGQTVNAPGGFLAQGNQIYQADDFGKIDIDQNAKKVDAAQQFNTQFDQITGQIDQKQAELQGAQVVLKQKVDDVTKAVQDQASKNDASYALIEAATKAHVANEVGQLEILRQKLAQVSRAYGNSGPTSSTASSTPDAPGFAKGGYTGQGDPSQPAGIVHKEEFVFDAASTRSIGVPRLRQLMINPQLLSNRVPAVREVQKELNQTITFPMIPTGDVYSDRKRAEFFAQSLPPPVWR